MDDLKVCRVCDSEFDPRSPMHKGGYIDVCGRCGVETQPRAVGWTASTGKSDYSMEYVIPKNVTQEKYISEVNNAIGSYNKLFKPRT